jgi:hypothetical protein
MRTKATRFLSNVHTTVKRTAKLVGKKWRPRRATTPSTILPIPSRKTCTTSKAYGVNRRGLFNWDRLDGKLWNTAELEISKIRPSVRQTESMSLLLQESDRRVSARSREVDKYLSGYYRAMLGVRQRFHPFDLYVAELPATSFPLRTSPRYIYRRLQEDLTKLSALDYEIQTEMDLLTGLGRVHALLPCNPSYFLARVERERTQANTAIRRAVKEYRAQYKLLNAKMAVPKF